MEINLATPVLYTLAGIFGLLTIATLTVLGLALSHWDTDYSELNARIKSWWVMVTIFSLAILLKHPASIIFFMFLSFIALREYLSVIPTRFSDRRVLLWAYLAIVLQYFWIYIGWYGMFLIFIPIYMFLLLPMRMLLTGETEGFLNTFTSIVSEAKSIHLFKALTLKEYLPALLNPAGAAINESKLLTKVFPLYH